MNVMSPDAENLQQSIIKQLDVRPFIDPEEEIARRVDFLVEYLKMTHAKGYVLGISGGQDSTLAGKLTQLAVERVEGAEFWAVRLPHGTQVDEDDAQIALDFIHPDHRLTVDIQPATAALSHEVARAVGQDSLNDFNRGNAKARLRMTAQYAIAGEVGALVVGTDHAAENVTAFYTKWGDGAADLLPWPGLISAKARHCSSTLARRNPPGPRSPPRIWKTISRSFPMKRRSASPTPTSMTT